MILLSLGRSVSRFPSRTARSGPAPEGVGEPAKSGRRHEVGIVIQPKAECQNTDPSTFEEPAILQVLSDGVADGADALNTIHQRLAAPTRITPAQASNIAVNPMFK